MSVENGLTKRKEKSTGSLRLYKQREAKKFGWCFIIEHKIILDLESKDAATYQTVCVFSLLVQVNEWMFVYY